MTKPMTFGWHGHPDQGSFVLNAHGEHLVTDRAMGAPYGTPKSDFSKSSLAHSIILIDGEGQVQYGSPVFHDREAGHTGQLLHTDFIDYVMADSTVAYRKNPKIGVMENAYRYFLFVRKPDGRAYVVIFDDIQMDDEAHQYDWLLQTGVKNTIKVEGQNRYTISGEAVLHMLTIEPDQVDMSQSDGHDIWRTMKLTTLESKQRGLFLNVLYPAPKGATIPRIRRLAGDGFVGASVDSEDTFLFATGNRITGNGIATDGQMAAVGQQSNRMKWFLCVRGANMEVDGQELFRSDKEITIALDDSGNGSILLEDVTTDHAESNVTIIFGNAEPVTLGIISGIAVIEHGQIIEGHEH
jgi:hypothetical protein